MKLRSTSGLQVEMHLVVEGSPSVRVARPEDLQSVLKLHEQGNDGPPWSASAWSALFNAPESAMGGVIALLLEDSEVNLLGYAVGSLHGGTAELEYLFVSAAVRGRGWGRVLLQAWMAMVEARGAVETFLEVRASNGTAGQLYTSMGFVRAGLRKQYYRDPVDDALVLRRSKISLSSDAEEADRSG